MYLSGTIGNVITAALWALYSLDITVTLPFITTKLREHTPTAQSSIAFTGDTFQDEIKSLGQAGIALNVFGWTMFSLAIMNIVILLVDKLFYRIKQSIGRGATKVPTKVQHIPVTLIAYISPVLGALLTFIQTICTIGVFASLTFVRIYVALMLTKHDVWCDDTDSTWNNTIDGCGSPDYTQSQGDWIDEDSCCPNAADSLCCAFNAPYEYGLKGALTHSTSNPFANQQRQLRKTADDTLSRKRYLMQTLYVNPNNDLFVQKRDSFIYAGMEFGLFIVGLMLILATATRCLELPKIYRTLKGTDASDEERRPILRTYIKKNSKGESKDGIQMTEKKSIKRSPANFRIDL